MESTGTIAAVVVASAALVAGATVATNEDAEQPCLKSPLAVVVDLNDVTHAHIIQHAQRPPRLLHLARTLADLHRRQALVGYPARTGYDRDEYPPAATVEGGVGADIAYINSSENRSAGAVMGNELRPYCDGQAFIVEAK